VENPLITVTKSTGAQIAQRDDGSFGTCNGTYTYVISAEGYLPISGSFTIDDVANDYKDDKNSIEVQMEGAQDYCTVSFKVTYKGGESLGEVSVKDSDGTTVAPHDDGTWMLAPGAYTYTVVSDHYETVTDTLTVTEEDKGSSSEISVALTDRQYWAFVNVQPQDVSELDTTTITVKNEADDTVEPFKQNKGEYRLTNGTYTYVVAAEGYQTATGSFTVEDRTQTVSVELKEVEKQPEQPSQTDTSTPAVTPGASGGSSGGASGGASMDTMEDSLETEESEETEEAEQPEIGRYTDIETEYHELTDVAEDDWYYEPINFLLTVGVFQGNPNGGFSPKQTMTRAMVVTVLYRLSGAEEPDAASTFTDVSSTAYYAKAVAWAQANGVIKGTGNGKFSPDAALTREGLATILQRYTALTGLDATAQGNGASLAFRDYDDVSSYAATSVNWAYEQGLYQGNSTGNLTPRASITRAEAAAVLARYLRGVL
jgi:hypothetical protein